MRRVAFNVALKRVRFGQAIVGRSAAIVPWSILEANPLVVAAVLQPRVEEELAKAALVQALGATAGVSLRADALRGVEPRAEVGPSEHRPSADDPQERQVPVPVTAGVRWIVPMPLESPLG